MKKFLLAMIVFCLSAPALSADKQAEVILRFSRQDGSVRLVVESADDMINRSSVATSLAAIKIDFPSGFDLLKQPDFIFEAVRKDRSLLIGLKDISEIKTARLSAPARLVFDLKSNPQPIGQKGFLQQIEKRLQQGASQGEQKSSSSQPVNGVPKLKTIVIDPGHGGYDFGIVDEDAKEKDVDLSLAKELSNSLAKKGRTVLLTRKSDQSGSLSERIDFSVRKKPDLFISLHASSSDMFAVYTSPAEEPDMDPATKLYTVYTNQSAYREKSALVADALGMALKAAFSQSVVLRELPLPVLYSMNSPAVLIEYPSLKSFASSAERRSLFIKAVLDGIAAYER